MIPARVGLRVRILRVIARLNVGDPAFQATLLTKRLDPSGHESLLITGRGRKGDEPTRERSKAATGPAAR